MTTRANSTRPGWRVATLAALCAGLMAACGGGGGDSSPDEGNPRFGTARLTVTNQETAARAALVVLTGGVASGAGSVLGEGRSVPLAAAGHAASDPAGLPWLAALPRQLLDRFASGGFAVPATSTSRALALQEPLVEACAFGGTRTLTFDDRDNNGLPSAGDVIEAIDAACRDSAEARTDGRLRVALTSVQVAPTLSFVGDAAFFDYVWQSTTSARRLAVGGPFRLEAGEPDANRVRIAITVGNDFVVGVTHPRGDDTVTLLSGYAVVVEELLSDPLQGGLPSVRTECNGVVDSRSLGGTILVFGDVPNFKQVGSDAHPREGVGHAVGGSGKLRLSAVSTSRVRVEGDFDGNGAVYESTVELGWDDLM